MASEERRAGKERSGGVTADPDDKVYRATRVLRNEFLKVRRIADTQLLDVLRTVRVHRVRARLFRCGNVRTRYDDAFDLSRGRRSTWRGRLTWNSGSRQLCECVGCKNERKSDARHQGKPNESERF